MKKLLMFIACALCAATVSAQEQKKVKETVTLNDGTVILGYVAKQSDGSYLIENESGDMFYYTAAEIKEVKKCMAEYGKEKGYMGMVNILAGCPFGLTVINGYRFSPHIYLGLETGINSEIFYALSWVNTSYGSVNHFALWTKIPINIYFQYIFSKKRTSLFMDTSVGINAYPYVKHGYYGGSDLIYVHKKIGANFSISLGGKSSMRKKTESAIWYGLQAGFSTLSYDFMQEVNDIYSNVQDLGDHHFFIPTICAKVALSF